MMLQPFILKYARWVEAGILLALLVAVFAFGYNYAHKDVATVQAKLDAALDANARQASVLKDCNDATVDAQKQEAEAKLREQKAGKELAELKAQKAKTVTVFVEKQNKLEQQPECAVLKEHICPAAMDY